MSSSKSKAGSKTGDASVMPLGEHLEELRKRLVFGLFGLLPLTMVCLYFGEPLPDFLITPVQDALMSQGLSPMMQAEVFNLARTVAQTGVTVLMVEQNVHGALQASDRAIVLELGRLFMEGTADAVLHDPRIRLAYLGGNIGATDERDAS